MSFETMKELMSDYDGSEDFVMWRSQLLHFQRVLHISDEVLSLVVRLKLKGEALVCYNSKKMFTRDVGGVLAELAIMFTKKENILETRRKFERRVWNFGEQFGSYANDKRLLSTGLSLCEEEFVEYLIDGIPNKQLQVQAKLHNFRTAGDVTRAFRTVELPRRAVPRTNRQSGEERLRCYNCNCSGHISKECSKPKREYGTCFACGERGHFAASCKLYKKSTSNNFVSYFSISIVDNPNINMVIECIIDSGSPVSLIKKSLVPGRVQLQEERKTYYGLNKSKLILFGKITCHIEVLNKRVLIELIVVPDESICYPIILGRNFIAASEAKLKVGNVEIAEATTSVNDENCVLECVVENSAKNKTNEVVNELMAIDLCDTNELEYLVGDKVGFEEKMRFQKLFYSEYLHSTRPSEPKVRKEISLVLADSKPFGCAPRRLSYSEKSKLQIILDEYLAKGYIRPSDSEFVSPIVLVKKKSGELRMCVDYRKLNKVTMKDNYPIPLIDDLLDRLANKFFFTKLDLKNGFFHVFVEKESIKYTSFTTPLGQFEFLRMPFGLNSPAVFQKFINTIFRDMIRSNEVIVYLDDFMIATETLDEHLQILRKVFQCLVQNKLELRLDKCEFLQAEISYLGYLVTGKGIRADKKGLKAVEDFAVPTKVQEVQSFLGLCSYFRRFIKDFSTIAKPLYDLLRKEEKFRFGQLELETFDNLKRRLIAAPVLAIYDPGDVTELHCDASSLGFGAILLQKKKDNKLHPVFYFSKRTTDVESRYHSFELETLAIVYALKRFRIYLQGTKFKIVTDCNSLTLTLNKKDMNPRIARWALELQNYDYELEHRIGKRMQHVDALSRTNNILAIQTNTFEENLIICQGRDEKIAKIKKELEVTESGQHEMRNGIVYKKKGEDLFFYVPESMECHVLYKYHDEMGHLGIDKVVETVGKSYWFPNMRKKTAAHVENCLKCIAFSNKSGKKEGFLHMIPKGNRPFEMIHIDHYGPIHSQHTKYKHVLAIVDSFTKFVRFYAAKTTASKEAVAALTDYFRAYSRPKLIISDRGTCFTSREFAEFLETNNVQHIKVATGSPQANGQVEIINKSLGPMIAKMVDSEKNLGWEKVLQSVEHAMNNTVHKAIKEQPSVMLFGVRQRGEVIDSLRENVLDYAQTSNNKSIEIIRGKAEEEQKNAQNYNKEYADAKRREPRKFRVGDYVVISNISSQIGASSKLIPKFKGPYRISKLLENDRYLVEDVEGFQQTQVPYKGTWSITNLKPWYEYNRTSSVTKESQAKGNN